MWGSLGKHYFDYWLHVLSHFFVEQWRSIRFCFRLRSRDTWRTDRTVKSAWNKTKITICLRSTSSHYQIWRYLCFKRYADWNESLGLHKRDRWIPTVYLQEQPLVSNDGSLLPVYDFGERKLPPVTQDDGNARRLWGRFKERAQRTTRLERLRNGDMLMVWGWRYQMWPGTLLHNSLIRSVKGLPRKSF